MVYVWDLIVKQKWQSRVSCRGGSCACPYVNRVYKKKDLLFRWMYSTIHIILTS